MTATSGRICSGALTRSDPIGSCVRTLLESSRWSSRAALLKWQPRILFSTRVMHFTDTDSKRPLPWNESATILKATDMKSRRCLYQLAPLVHRTDGTESLSSGTVLLQTPTTVQTDESPERESARAEKKGYKNGTKFGSLTCQIKYDKRIQTMLFPTPLAVEVHHKARVTRAIEQGQTTFHARPDKGKDTHPSSITDYLQFLEMLSTPRASDNSTGIAKEEVPYLDGHIWRRPNGVSMRLSSMANRDLLPIPVTQDFKKRGTNDAAEASQVADDGIPSRLSPLFTEEMMGFNFQHTTMPFTKGEIVWIEIM